MGIPAELGNIEAAGNEFGELGANPDRHGLAVVSIAKAIRVGIPWVGGDHRLGEVLVPRVGQVVEAGEFFKNEGGLDEGDDIGCHVAVAIVPAAIEVESRGRAAGVPSIGNVFHPGVGFWNVVSEDEGRTRHEGDTFLPGVVVKVEGLEAIAVVFVFVLGDR